MAKKNTSLAPAAKAIDPTLDALFSSSAGPLKAPSKTRYSAPAPVKAAAAEESDQEDEEEEDDDEENEDEDDEVLSEISEEFDDEQELGSDDDEEASDDEDEDVDMSDEKETASAPAAAAAAVTQSEAPRERKRKRKDEHDDLESKYLIKLAQEDEDEKPEGKRRRASPSADNDDDDDTDVIPVHESLAKTTDEKDSDIDKANRTVFLSNVTSEAITSKKAKKTLIAHLTSIFKDEPSAPKVESVRFRSVAFSEMGMPKRAAFITGSLLEATTKSTNAYAVYSTPAAARKAAAELNGTMVLDRHLRVDSVAHPAATDHRRCVFVGNLGFVDDETIVKKGPDGEETTKKRNKVPSDIEEGLWRTFGKQGKVESVRVIRDSKTRVGKGFAYVQFYDANDVEGALLLNEKKFPPMLPRALRVTRAKDPRKTALAQERSQMKALALASSANQKKSMKYKHKSTPEELSMAGRTGKLLGRQAVWQQRKGGAKPGSGDGDAAGGAQSTMKTPEQIVFEGRRVSRRDTMPTDLKGKKGKGKGKKVGKPQHRGARRAAEWKKKQD